MPLTREFLFPSPDALFKIQTLTLSDIQKNKVMLTTCYVYKKGKRKIKDNEKRTVTADAIWQYRSLAFLFLFSNFDFYFPVALCVGVPDVQLLWCYIVALLYLLF